MTFAFLLLCMGLLYNAFQRKLSPERKLNLLKRFSCRLKHLILNNSTVVPVWINLIAIGYWLVATGTRISLFFV